MDEDLAEQFLRFTIPPKIYLWTVQYIEPTKFDRVFGGETDRYIPVISELRTLDAE